MKEYKRICKECNKELIYKSFSACWLANKNGSICKSCASKIKSIKLSDLSILLKECNESYYWIGFLLADGNFTKGRLKLTLAIKDEDHLRSFAKYINYKGSFNKKESHISVSAMDIDIVNKICKKFDIKQNKTYNPTNMLLKNNELYYSLIAGFIDGDGCIKRQNKRKDFSLTIKLHSSWKSFLNQINNIISIKNTTKINNCGYASFSLSNTTELKKLKNNIIKCNIPIMKRKWDIIDLNFVSRYEVSDKLKNDIIDLLNNNKSINEMSKLLNKKYTTIYNCIKRNKICCTLKI